MQHNTRYPAVAEEFYPSGKHELETLLGELAEPETSTQSAATRALIVPHAAYRYSGSVAAGAFSKVAGRSCSTVVLMGDAHAYLFDGIAIDPHDYWHSPLGEVPVDPKMGRVLTERSNGLFHELDIAHHCDHVLEVQIPFLQHLLEPGFSILPVLFGRNDAGIYRTAAEHLLTVLGNNDLLIASTDLSHYPSYRDAAKIDRVTLEHMANRDIEGLESHEREIRQRTIPGATSTFCSPEAVKTLLEVARIRGWQAGEPVYRNSGDAMHDDRLAVVGYGSIAFHQA
jgi:AmmeMemoRadiSam system protein B